MASNNYVLILLPLSLFLMFLTTDINCVQITSMNIPSYFTLDNDNEQNNLLLDCEYEIDDNETDLVVKWFKDHEPIYQWIEGGTHHAFRTMRNLIDMDYQISDHPRQKYRAISFINPTTELSGEYKCIIQTRTMADSRISYLEVLDLTNMTFTLNQEKHDGYTILTCHAGNIKPIPILDLRINKLKEVNIVDRDIYNDTEGYFDVTIKGNISDSNIDQDDDELGCLLTFKNTNFTMWYSDQFSSIKDHATSINNTLMSTVFIVFISILLNSLI